MIKSLTVVNYLGDRLKIELTRPGETGFAVKSITGLGPVKADVNVTDITTNDGGLFNSARLSTRNIVISFLFMMSDEGETIEDVRQKSYRYFPIKKDLTLFIETDNRTLKTTGYVESNEPEIFSKEESCKISVVCPDPNFYSEENNETVFYGVKSLFEFPFENNSLTIPLIEMGEINNKSENVIFYNGDSEIGVSITIHAVGEATNITIYNTGTRERMFVDTEKLCSLTGYGIIPGDTIIITTTKGNKGAKLLRAGRTVNILNCISRNCDWFSLTKGDNVFAYAAESGGSNLQFVITNQIIYEGV